MSTRGYWMFSLALIALAAVASLAIYPQLPQRMPIHWNIHNQPDDYADKAWGAFLIPAVMLGLYLLFAVLPWLSPRPFALDRFRSTYGFIVFLIIGLAGYVHAITLYSTLRPGVDMGRWIVAGMLLFFTALGAVMGKVRRNFYVGIRTPWTLANERVWDDTHRFAAWSIAGSSVLGLAAIMLGASPLVVGLALIPIGFLSPAVYSFVHYKRLERAGAISISGE